MLCGGVAHGIVVVSDRVGVVLARCRVDGIYACRVGGGCTMAYSIGWGIGCRAGHGVGYGGG